MEQETGEELPVEDVARDWATAFVDILFFELDWQPASEFADIQSIKVPVSV